MTDERQRFEASSREKASWYPVGYDRVVARVAGGLKLVCDTRDFSLTPHLVMDGFWESWISIWFMRALQAERRTGIPKLLNIGANCGYYAILGAKLGARVVAVEPQPGLAKNIELSAALNGLGDLVSVERCVAGAEEGEVTLVMHEYLAGSAYVMPGLDVEVPDGWWSDGVIQRPAHELMPDATCAFIDAEGYEPDIWTGLKPLLDANQLSWVVLEWSPTRYEDPESFLKKLRSYGPVTVVVADGSERPMSDEELLRGSEWDTVVVRRTFR